MRRYPSRARTQTPTLSPVINDTMHKHKELFGKTWLSDKLKYNRYQYHPTSWSKEVTQLVKRAKREIDNVEALNGLTH